MNRITYNAATNRLDAFNEFGFVGSFETELEASRFLTNTNFYCNYDRNSCPDGV